MRVLRKTKMVVNNKNNNSKLIAMKAIPANLIVIKMITEPNRIKAGIGTQTGTVTKTNTLAGVKMVTNNNMVTTANMKVELNMAKINMATKISLIMIVPLMNM